MKVESIKDFVSNNIEALQEAAQQCKNQGHNVLLFVDVCDNEGAAIADAAVGKPAAEKMRTEVSHQQGRKGIIFGMTHEIAIEYLSRLPTENTKSLRAPIPPDGFKVVAIAFGGIGYFTLLFVGEREKGDYLSEEEVQSLLKRAPKQ